MTELDLNPGGQPFEAAPDAPDWFLDNLRQPGVSRHANANGRRVHFLSWNWEREDLPTLLLVHGFSGHAHWWSFLAPFFTEHYRVAAIDLPGMGDSDPLPEYSDECFARGILGVVEDYQLTRPTVVGHSFGGVQSIRAMALAPEAFGHGIVVDSLVRFPPEEPPRVIDGKPVHQLRADQAECMARFRISPPQPDQIDAVVDYIAYHSCTGDERGWHWKFDSRLRNFGEINDPALLSQVTTPVDCIYGALSMFTPGGRPQQIIESFPNGGELVMIPDGHHHLMVDHPLELVAALRQLLDKQSG